MKVSHILTLALLAGNVSLSTAFGGKRGKRGKRGRKPYPKPRPKPRPKPTPKPVPKPTPKPFPAPTAPCPNCFSGESTVELEGGEMVPMKNLKILDKVKVGSGEYQTVYGFAHKHETVPIEYLQIFTTPHDDPIEMTVSHLVYRQGEKNAVRADSIVVGDVLQVPEKDGGAKVVKIQSVVRKGLYAPLTPDSTIVVNGIVASNYISHAKDEGGDKEYGMVVGGINTGITAHDMSHKWHAPYRVYCNFISSTRCQDETYDELGFNAWNTLAMKINIYTHVTAKDNAVFQIVLFYAVVIPVMIFYWMERLVAYTWPFLLLIAGVWGIAAFKKRKNRGKEKVM